MSNHLFKQVETLAIEKNNDNQTFARELLEKVKEEIEKENETIEEISKKNSFGFEISEKMSVPNPVLKEKTIEKQKISEEIKSCEKFSQSHVNFYEKLHNKGLEPIAVLPVKLWDALCKKFKLIRFEHLNSEGKTGFSNKRSNINPRSSNNPPRIITAYIFSAFIVWVCCLFSFFISKIDSLMIIIGSTTTLIGMVIIIGMDTAFFKLLVTLFSTNRFLPYILWKGGVDHNSIPKVTVRFRIKPSEHFQRALAKVLDLNLHPCIAAVPAAISINRTELLKEINDEIRRKDPILYYKEGDMIAVLSQVGEFANEKRVIEWVKRKGLLISFN